MKINSRYGVAKREKNPTKMKEEVGYLGHHYKIPEVGDEKHILFQDGADVPLRMTPQEHLATKFSQYDDPQLKYKAEDELLGNLKSDGVDIYIMKWKRVGELQDSSLKNYNYVTK